MKHPAEIAFHLIEDVLHKGSSKDGANEAWRDMPPNFHFIKALSHLSHHLKETYDPRAIDGENHAHLALTRIAMGIANMQKPSGS